MKIGVIIISHSLKVSERKDPQHTLFCGKTYYCHDLRAFWKAFVELWKVILLRRAFNESQLASREPAFGEVSERLLSQSFRRACFQKALESFNSFRRAFLLMASPAVVVIYYRFGKFEVLTTSPAQLQPKTTHCRKNYAFVAKILHIHALRKGWGFLLSCYAVTLLLGFYYAVLLPWSVKGDTSPQVTRLTPWPVQSPIQLLGLSSLQMINF